MVDLSALFAFNVSSFVQAFLLLFSIFDAIGTVPVFLALTEPFQDKRPKIIRQSVSIATIILLVFAFFGIFIFQVLGITIDDFRIAGGIILFMVAFDYLRGKVGETKTTEPEEVAAFPLAMPLLAGPGAISTAIILVNPPFGPLIAILVIVLNAIFAWVILSRGVRVQHLLGTNGTKIFTRIMGLLIASIGIAFVREGIVAIARSVTGG